MGNEERRARAAKGKRVESATHNSLEAGVGPLTADPTPTAGLRPRPPAHSIPLVGLHRDCHGSPCGTDRLLSSGEWLRGGGTRPRPKPSGRGGTPYLALGETEGRHTPHRRRPTPGSRAVRLLRRSIRNLTAKLRVISNSDGRQSNITLATHILCTKSTHLRPNDLIVNWNPLGRLISFARTKPTKLTASIGSAGCGAHSRQRPGECGPWVGCSCCVRVLSCPSARVCACLRGASSDVEWARKRKRERHSGWRHQQDGRRGERVRATTERATRITSERTAGRGGAKVRRRT